MQIRQIRSTDGTGTLSYIVIDEVQAKAILIDPNIEDVKRISEFIRNARVELTHIFDTHTHVDHVSGAGELKAMFGSHIVMHENTKNKWKVIDLGDRFGIGETLRANAKIAIDMHVNDGDTLTSGGTQITILFTPGHTDNHIALQTGDNIFTGDLLLIGQAGRSDLPGGDPEAQYDSLMNRVIPLPDNTTVYPGHDYENNVSANLGEEKRTNPFLKRRTKQEYVQFVREFFPPLAETAGGSGRATLQCGVRRIPTPDDAFRNITAHELREKLKNSSGVFLLDVREPVELMMTGAIEGVQNISVRQLRARTDELPENKSVPIVSICASGSRSVEAAHILLQAGYSNVMNLVGGTTAWIGSGFPVVRPAVRI